MSTFTDSAEDGADKDALIARLRSDSDALRRELDLLMTGRKLNNATIAALMQDRDVLRTDRDRYGKALDNVGEMASQLFYELHGRKMDGPHNKTEVILLDIGTACTAALNGEENPRA